MKLPPSVTRLLSHHSPHEALKEDSKTVILVRYYSVVLHYNRHPLNRDKVKTRRTA